MRIRVRVRSGSGYNGDRCHVRTLMLIITLTLSLTLDLNPVRDNCQPRYPILETRLLADCQKSFLAQKKRWGRGIHQWVTKHAYCTRCYYHSHTVRTQLLRTPYTHAFNIHTYDCGLVTARRDTQSASTPSPPRKRVRRRSRRLVHKRL